MPVFEILATVPADELGLWRDYLAEPRGDKRLDHNVSLITAAIYQFMNGFSKRRMTIKPSDCLLKFEKGSSIDTQINALIGVFGKDLVPQEILDASRNTDS